MKNNKNKNMASASQAQIDSLLKEYSYGSQAITQRISHIMSEFTRGFEFLRLYKKAVSVYGSARFGFESNIYKEAYVLSYHLAKDGFAIITGGGSGIMEAANRGAYEAGGKSVGLNIKLKQKQQFNKYVIESEEFEHFFVRKTMLSFASKIYIFFPGGFGTLDEFFEMLMLVQTEKIPRLPIILVNKNYWNPLVNWFDKYLYKKVHAVGKDDLKIYYLVNDADEAYRLINKLIREKKVPL